VLVEREYEPYTRHDEVPVYEQRGGMVDATFYNHVQVALKRIGKYLRMPIPGLRTLDLILQHDAWIVVDRALNDLPVAAWSDFHREGSALHLPVTCRIRLYHGNAGMILKRVLQQMDGALSEALQSSNHRVIGFRKQDES
jgi:hypothetical protein